MARRKKIDIALLKMMRKEAEFTQKELALRIGISRETVSAIERGVPETINKLETDVVSNWHIVCRQKLSPDTDTEFLSHILQYFGFSEQNLIKLAKKLTRSNDGVDGGKG
ncbi:XRE family transcriptional regulator [Alteromonadaceae bacterium M269]|nr:XRE family transcriptional regulator [Alteromonadaceae bacterium M269]